MSEAFENRCGERAGRALQDRDVSVWRYCLSLLVLCVREEEWEAMEGQGGAWCLSLCQPSISVCTEMLLYVLQCVCVCVCPEYLCVCVRACGLYPVRMIIYINKCVYTCTCDLNI